jgi:hypothetical protein
VHPVAPQLVVEQRQRRTQRSLAEREGRVDGFRDDARRAAGGEERPGPALRIGGVNTCAALIAPSTSTAYADRRAASSMVRMPSVAMSAAL